MKTDNEIVMMVRDRVRTHLAQTGDVFLEWLEYASPEEITSLQKQMADWILEIYTHYNGRTITRKHIDRLSTLMDNVCLEPRNWDEDLLRAEEFRAGLIKELKDQGMNVIDIKKPDQN